jgi:hypothetical protein
MRQTAKALANYKNVVGDLNDFLSLIPENSD